MQSRGAGVAIDIYVIKTQHEVHMATENCSQPISKTFEQIVYFFASVASYQTNLK